MLITRAKVDHATVAERLGHSNPGMTLSIYAHPDEERSTQAATAFGTAIAETDSDQEDETGSVSPE